MGDNKYKAVKKKEKKRKKLISVKKLDNYDYEKKLFILKVSNNTLNNTGTVRKTDKKYLDTEDHLTQNKQINK